MMALRAGLLAMTVFGFGTVAALAQTAPGPSVPAAPETAVPGGLVRASGSIMMAPIPDSEDVGGVPAFATGRRQSHVHFLGAPERQYYARAFDAADRGDWVAARSFASRGEDPIGIRLIEWRRLLDKYSGATFAEICEFLNKFPDWPNRRISYARAERAIDPRMDDRAVLDWFGDRAPVSDLGKIRLGEALITTGAVERGKALIREGWIDGSFEPDQEFAIIQRHGELFTPDIDRARLERLLWRDDTRAARRELARVPSDVQHMAEARLMLRTSPDSGQRLIADLPETLRSDPGIVFERAHLLRQQMNLGEIPQLLVRAPTHELAKLSPSRWWGELNLAAREAIQTSSYSNAYAIVAHTGLTSGDGTEYSEAEFLAGWLALRFLNDPHAALVHFQNLAQAVSRPISRARANYWEGRAYEAQGNIASAWQHYRHAADAPETFYGQLALARITGEPQLRMHDPAIDASAIRNDYEHEALTRAIHILADLGAEPMLRHFAVHDVVVYNDPRHVKLLAEDLVRMGFREIAVRVAKEASYSGTLLLSYSHPVIAVPSYSGPGLAPDPALVLGIIRQETEFDPEAVSAAGARGIIQVMPAGARHTAKLAHLPYRPNDLTTNPTYDMKLGMTELAGALSDWGGSYILAVAAYNAGGTNVRRWLATYGDPRDGHVDPIDWIEEIPFGETRNYVQRVLENTEVYRSRLEGDDQRLQILADLYRPASAPATPPLQYVPVAPGPGGVPAPVPRPASTSPTPIEPLSPPSEQISSRTAPQVPDVAPKRKPEH